MVAASAEMRRVLRIVQRSAPSENHLTICGETGTGKSRIARIILEQSARRDQPLAVFDAVCAGPVRAAELLFGRQVDGRWMPGALESASGGTLFLDQLHELPFVVQCELTETLRSGQLRISGHEWRPIDVRVIAMCHLPLHSEMRSRPPVAAGLWRQIRGANIQLPPLRQRRIDIAPLAQDFLIEFAAAYAVPVFEFSREAVAKLERYSWPGNVRQLRDAVRRATRQASADVIDESAIIWAPETRPRDPIVNAFA